MTACPCGATPLSELLPGGVSRTSCLDPVPTCSKTCGRRLLCSTPGNFKPSGLEWGLASLGMGLVSPGMGLASLGMGLASLGMKPVILQGWLLFASLPSLIPDNPHHCPAPCHEGECPPCDKSTSVRCQCGRASVRVACVEVEGMGGYQCQHVCNKKKSCGRHRCNVRCCTVRTSGRIVASSPGPRLFRLHEGKSQGLVSKVT